MHRVGYERAEPSDSGGYDRGQHNGTSGSHPARYHTPFLSLGFGRFLPNAPAPRFFTFVFSLVLTNVAERVSLHRIHSVGDPSESAILRTLMGTINPCSRQRERVTCCLPGVVFKE